MIQLLRLWRAALAAAQTDVIQYASKLRSYKDVPYTIIRPLSMGMEEA